MDIIRFKGGLGNQMFQYALLKALSTQGREVMGSLGFYAKNPLLAPFCLSDVFANASFDVVDENVFVEKDEQWREIKKHEKELESFLRDFDHRFFWVEEQSGTYDERIFETNNCVFVGYWQTEKYFRQIRKELLWDFQFSKGEEKLDRLKRKFLTNNYVSVHIRRGDYLKHPEIYGNICDEAYYDAALSLVRENINNPVFVFFSDEIQWVKEHYKYKDALYIEAEMFEHYQSWYDMSLMSCCAFNIIANSTFSWWGAWLNQRAERKVIAPKSWFNEREMPDICPEDWIRLGGKEDKEFLTRSFRE